ncbi:MAG: ATP-binding cassette domain-containing protein [Mycoplasmatales bacterium]|nr:ATP-binding cassette domain-containing protein [Mycoplasmatales bacterium]
MKDSLLNPKNLFFVVLFPIALVLLFGYTLKENEFAFAFPSTLSYIAISIGLFKSFDNLSNFQDDKMGIVFSSYKISKKQLITSYSFSCLMLFLLISIFPILISFIFYVYDFLYFLIFISLSLCILIFGIYASLFIVKLPKKISFKIKLRIVIIFYSLFLVFSGSTIPSSLLFEKLGNFYYYLGFVFPPAGFANLSYLINAHSSINEICLFLVAFLSEIIFLIILTYYLGIKFRKYKIKFDNFSFDRKILINNMSIKIGNDLIMKNINVDINNGEIVQLIGDNGAGKSVLLESIIYKLSLNKIPVSYIAQEINFYYLINIKDLLLLFIKINALNTNAKTKNAKEYALKLLKDFSLENKSKKSFFKLSSGEKQKIKIIIGLINNSDILIFDEVSSSLDIESKSMILNLFKKRYTKNNKILILVSHDKDFPITDIVTKKYQIKDGELWTKK